MAQSAKVRWGVLSTARITADVVPCLRRSETSELVAVASRDRGRADRFAAENQVERAYGSYSELLEDPSIDCVYVPLPNGLHAEWTERALRAGKHVLCEKPLTPTASEAEALFALADELGLVLGEAFMYRHHPQTLRLKELVSEGAVGELRLMRATFAFTVPDPSTDIRYSAELAGGALRDVGCYAVSAAAFLTECPPERAVGIAEWSATGVDESFYATLEHGDSVITQFDCSLRSPLRLWLTAIGSEGELHVPSPWYPHLPPHLIEVRTQAGTERKIPAPGANPYLLEIDNVADAIRGRADLVVRPEETISNLKTIDLLLQDAQRRRELDAHKSAVQEVT